MSVVRPTPAPDVHGAEERRRAARALLRQPLLRADAGTDAGTGTDKGADAFRLVRRHREELQRIFAAGLGYRLEVDATVARLYKSGLGRDGTRPLRRVTGGRLPVTPRTYALLCLLLAALTRSRDQLMLDELVAEVRATLAEAEFDADLDAPADRRALHAALMALVELGVLAEREGHLAEWADDPAKQSLLDVRRDRLRLMVSAPLSAAEGPDDLLRLAALPSASGGARVAVRRRLVESPVMSVSDLPDEQAEWWAKNRNREREWFRETFGLELELRAEGALALDPDEELTDFAFPGTGSDKRAALLLAEQLVLAVRDAARDAPVAERGEWPVPADMLDTAMAVVREEFGRGLRKAHREDADLLRSEALDVLVAAGLLRQNPEPSQNKQGWLLHAAAARYKPRPALAATGSGGVASLFDEEEL